MIYEAIEKFKTQCGLMPSLDTHDNGTSQCVLLNFDSAKNPENNGGYVSLRLEDGFYTLNALMYMAIYLPSKLYTAAVLILWEMKK